MPAFTGAIDDRYYSTWPLVRNDAVVNNLSAVAAHAMVPWLFRSVNLRAQLVSRMPFVLMKAGVDVTDDPAYKFLLAGIKKRLYLTEASKCLAGQAYWLLETNEFGLNLTPRWAVPRSIQPIGNELTGLTGFQRVAGKTGQLSPDQVVYFWNPNYTCEYLPGVGEAEVALGAASMLYALDAFTANFFNQGAVKVTVFPVPPGTAESDITNLNNFLKRRMNGVRNAFKSLVMRLNEKLTPIVIGSDVKDTQAVELTDAQRDNVAVALGVPPTVIDGKAANFATANSEMMGLYINTIIPECEMLAEVANEQFFDKHYGVTLEFTPEKIEIMQSAQLDQVSAVTQAVGSPVLDVDEGRDLLGYPPRIQPLVEGSIHKPKRVYFSDVGAGAQAAPAAVTKALAAWRKDAIEAVKAQRPIGPGAPGLPVELGQAVARDLTGALTVADVREVFERHWPTPVKASGGEDDALREAVRELERYNDLLEAAHAAPAP